MEELKVDKERVLEAMKSCPDFEQIAKRLWPELEKPKTKVIDLDWRIIKRRDGAVIIEAEQYVVVVFKANGTMVRAGCIGEEAFQLDSEGRVVETE